MLQFCDRLFTQQATLSVIPSTIVAQIQSAKQFAFECIQTVPLVEDFRTIFARDPAARNWLEVLCCYPGFHAIVCYRFAHWLYCRNIPFFPRLISHLGRCFTGIEIHPGAVLGKGIVIDHGMGVVIGETAIVGDYALIYQGVTLGGTGKESGKRHPTVGNHVVIGAGAKILGNICVGNYARIGAGSIILRDVPSHCTAVGVPGRNLCRTNTQDCPLEHGQIPDPEAIAILTLVNRIEHLEEQLQSLKLQTLTLCENQTNATAS
ncbi:serine O-acetyltransferase [[Phormidium ambiguum] IAM M-71]|uniref:Serine acetyltransferase n=1 Tax=[Phormidium ambiguum] IAM M-71 TaxID=454136 RepID=A0A1U7IP24_9CYAN|nr:serine O-acetyltransferase [Phormidium ambiguum]OKH39118.1 serine O-acetyltransferase [Phormidium ambiguum IAM M-71]